MLDLTLRCPTCGLRADMCFDHGDDWKKRAARGTVGHPVCAFHGKTADEHEFGRCLYCCLCFETLTPGDCWQDENGGKWDVCVPCREAELPASGSSDGGTRR